MTRAVILLVMLSLAACRPPDSGDGDGPGPVDAVDAVDAVGAVDVPRAGSVVDLEGHPRDPLDGSGVAVLVFVSTHCPISNRYAPTLARLAADWADDGVSTWLVYPDPDDGPDAIRAHREAFSLSLPTLRDPGHRLVARAGARVTPEAAVFTPRAAAPAYVGRIDDRVVRFGVVRAQPSSHDLHDAVDALIEGRAPAAASGPAIGCYISDLR